MRLHRFHHFPTNLFRVQKRIANPLTPNIGGHNDNRVLEIDGASLSVCHSAIIKHLEQDVEYFRMRLLGLVKQDNAVRMSSDRFGQLSAFIVADVSRWCADQSGDGVFLHVLAHINTCHSVRIVKQEFGERFGEMRFTDTSRSHEKERTERSIRITETDASASNRIGDSTHSLILPDHLFSQTFFHAKEFLSLAFHESRNRNTGPLRYNFSNVFCTHAFLQHLRALCVRFQSFSDSLEP